MNPQLKKAIDDGVVVTSIVEPKTGVQLYSFAQSGMAMYADRWSCLFQVNTAISQLTISQLELETRVDSILNILANSKKEAAEKLQDVHRVVYQIKDMLAYQSPVNIYMTGALILMDDTESPLTFDLEYAKEKMIRWASIPEMLPFLYALQPSNGIEFSEESLSFTMMSLQEIAQRLKLSEVSSRALRELLLKSYTMDNNNGTMKNLEWLMAMYRPLAESAGYLSRTT